MKKRITFLICLIATMGGFDIAESQPQCDYSDRVEELLQKMTLSEKIGQLNQYAGGSQSTGLASKDTTIIEQVKNGSVGSMLNIKGVENIRTYQEYAMESRLQIPLIFALDVIHGLQTIYPIPLAEASSFDLDLMRRTAEGAALEASSIGINWTFAPMVDVSRDARWGRVMEGSGEDTWYGAQVAKARVKGFQGDDLSSPNTILACAKHFAAYGACIGGRDYNSADLSLNTLYEFYLPPFKAALEANVGSVMNSFNELNGIPATGNKFLVQDILKGDWGFGGLVVSDWGSIRQMINQGYSKDLRDAAHSAIDAGCDMDMESRAFHHHLAELVESGEVAESQIDEAVRRVLLIKFQLGLFDDPFKYCDPIRESENVLSDELMALSKEAAEKSVVLIKNQDSLLPLASPRSIVVVGSLSRSKADMLGAWAFQGDKESVSTLYDGLKERFGQSEITYVEGYDIDTNAITLSKSELRAIAKADVVIAVVGERATQSGESRSKADIEINAAQQNLISRIAEVNSNVVTVIMAGRPTIFTQIQESSKAILYAWWLGSQAGNALSSLLAGDYNPSAKLPMTFPRSVGQVPIYYNYNNTGHPHQRGANYTTGYIDVDFEPAYCFGYGLSYSRFELSGLRVDRESFSDDQCVEVSVDVENCGAYRGVETIQLYIRDMSASIVRPLKELRGFKQVALDPNQRTTVSFILDKDDLGFYDASLSYVTEKGSFKIMVGTSSDQVEHLMIEYK